MKKTYYLVFSYSSGVCVRFVV